MKIEYLGDVHLGKVFKTGVPLHRQGDREAMVWAEFETNLLNTEADLHIQVGDIFDKMIVPYWVIYRAAMTYRRAVQRNPQTKYVVLRGNHDASRDADKISAFQIFSELVRPYGVTVVDDHVVKIANHLLVPWHPFKNAMEMLADLYSEPDATAVGHWDLVMGQDNQLPAMRLRELGVVRAVTGHDHNARELEIDGLPVTVTGSMQPYSHGEDEAERFYVTRSLAQVAADPDAFRDKALRVRLVGDEVYDLNVDCLQLTFQREEDGQVVDLGEVDFDAFDLGALFDQAREEVGLDAEFGQLIKTKLEETRALQS